MNIHPGKTILHVLARFFLQEKWTFYSQVFAMILQNGFPWVPLVSNLVFEWIV